jgi:hypothetical protein
MRGESMARSKTLGLVVSAFILLACSSSALSDAQITSIKDEIRAEYEKKFPGVGDGSVQEVYLNTVDGKVTGYVRFIAAGVKITHSCEVTVYDNGEIVWGCTP